MTEIYCGCGASRLEDIMCAECGEYYRMEVEYSAGFHSYMTQKLGVHRYECVGGQLVEMRNYSNAEVSTLLYEISRLQRELSSVRSANDPTN